MCVCVCVRVCVCTCVRLPVCICVCCVCVCENFVLTMSTQDLAFRGRIWSSLVAVLLQSCCSLLQCVAVLQCVDSVSCVPGWDIFVCICMCVSVICGVFP